MRWWLIIVSIWISSVQAEDASTTYMNFTYAMALRCKEYICRHGYHYETFFRIEKDTRMTKNPDLILEMHIAIQAPSNGHILLSPVPHPSATDPVYEIVVGGGKNKFSELRRNLRRNPKYSAPTAHILSTIEFRAFYLKIGIDGRVEFGKEGDSKPILIYYDTDLPTLEYFSFASWNDVEAKFLYDCPPPGEEEPSTYSKAMERKLSNSDQLKKELLMGRMPELPPHPIVTVKLGVRVTNVKYNAFTAKLSVTIAFLASWTDDTLAWNPNKFNGTTSLTFRPRQIWRPKFFVYNSDDNGMIYDKNSELISVVYSGEATYHLQTKIDTWCAEPITTYNKWPHDEYECAIIIQPWETHEIISLEAIRPNDDKMRLFTDIDEIVKTEWRGSISQMVIGANGNESDKFLIHMNLSRRPTAYNMVFYTPLVVLIIFILMSFWSEPLKISRVWFYTGTTMTICMGLCYIDYLIPCHTVPSILVLYITVLSSSLTSLLIHVFFMTSTMEKLSNTQIMQTVLTSKPFRMMFCLPPMKTCGNYNSINEGYSTQEDDDSGVVIVPRNGNVEEMQSDETTYASKHELAEVVDKVLFVVYSVVFACMFAFHF